MSSSSASAEKMEVETSKITEIRRRGVRLNPHSHIRGLNGDNSGLVGQTEAREAANIVVQMIKAKKMSGRAILMVGGPGTGKTALAVGISKELGPKVPFVPLTGSEVYSSEVKKTEVLFEHFRRAMGVRIKEMKEVYEGEVTEVTPEEGADPTGGYGKRVTRVVLGLKTTKGTKTLKLDPTIYDSLQKEKVEVGDVVFMEANSGAVKRVGRCDVYAGEVDLEAEEYVPLPKGSVHKRKEVVQDVTLHDLDVANAAPQGGQDILSMVNQLMKSKKTEITEKLRSEVNKIVNTYIEQGTAEMVPGVLFIDEVHMLDLECFAFLNRMIESTVCPVIVLASNRGNTFVRDQGAQTTRQKTPHGMPLDLLDRCLIVRTEPLSVEHVWEILTVKCRLEKVAVQEETLKKLALCSAQGLSVRYLLQLLTPLKILCQAKGVADGAGDAELEEVMAMFLDAKRSLELVKNSKGFIE